MQRKGGERFSTRNRKERNSEKASEREIVSIQEKDHVLREKPSIVVKYTAGKKEMTICISFVL